MSLDSAPISTPTTAEIAEFIQNEYKSLTGATFIPDGGPVWVMSWALAAVYVLIYRFGTWAFNQIFFNSADPSNKKERGAEYGMSQGTGQRAVLQVTGGGGTPSALLPAGTLVTTPDEGYLYKVVSDTYANGSGSITAEIKAEEAGEEYDEAGASNSVQLVAPLAGVPNTLFYTGTTTPGADPETDEDYFNRIDSRIKRQPQGGSPGDYYLWSTEVDGIVDIVIYTQAAGEVDVYAIADGVEGTDKVPDAAELAAVVQSIETSGDFVYNDRRPIDADVYVHAIEVEEYSVTLTGFTSNGGTPAQEAAINEAIREYMGTLRPSNPQLGKIGNITEVNANIVSNIVNTLTLAAGFTVDTVSVYYDPNGLNLEVDPKRSLAQAKVAQYTGTTIAS